MLKSDKLVSVINEFQNNDKNIENLKLVIENLKTILDEQSFQCNWDASENIFRSEETYIILFTLSTINTISHYLQNESCLNKKSVDKFYIAITEINNLWCK